MIGNPRYGRIGLVVLPYYLLFELLGPVIELVGLAAVVTGLALGSQYNYYVKSGTTMSATIHPGVMTFTNASSFLGGASQCTSNFVFTDPS